MRQTMLACLGTALLVLFTAAASGAATITVTTTNDGGPGSLRDAIATASAGDTIVFSLTYPAVIGLTAPIVVSTNVTISGPGATELTVSGNDLVQVFDLPVAVTVTMSGLTIAHGHGSNGGGIENDGTLTLTRCVVTANAAAAYHGGGILNNGTLSLSECTLSSNSAPWGGALFNSGAATISACALVNNVSSFAGGGGAGILNDTPGSLAITNSTVAGNVASWGVGGIFNYGSLVLSNSTLSENTGAVYGVGGIMTQPPSSTTLKNTIVANNPPGNCQFVQGGLTSLGHNASDDATCSAVLYTPTDLDGVPVGLDPNGLQDNGGPTPTIALVTGSPAIDAIPVSDCTLTDGVTPLATDQRGVSRPQGPGCDIGAFEFVRSPQAATQAIVEDVAALCVSVLNRGNCRALTAKLEAAIDQMNRGNNLAARGQLNAFVDQVDALLSAGRLPALDAARLTDAAEAVMALIQ